MAKIVKQIQTGLNKVVIGFLWTVVSWIVLGMLIIAIIEFTDDTYENCMKKCVLPDNSNYSDCIHNTCDFPI